MHIGRGDPQIGKEHIGEQRIVVLAGVDDPVIDSSLPKGAVDWRELDELGPGPDDGHYAHGQPRAPRCFSDFASSARS